VENFEFLRNVTIGQYFQGDSIVHRIDPRAKITVLVILAIVNGFIFSYLGNAILLAVCIGMVLASGISFRFILSGIKPALPFILMLALLQLFFSGAAYRPYGMPSQTYWQWGSVSVTSGSLQLVCITSMRFLEIFLLVSLLTATSTITDLAYAIESMLRPLQRFGVPAHELSLVGTIALRFVPIFAEQLETLMKAQASRGADFGSSGLFGFVKTTRQLVSLLVPLFVDAFRRAEELILAMEARCYTGGRGRTRLVRFRIRRLDRVVVVVGLVFAGLMLYFRDRFWF
jgi:energy-coupling factor transport system permease protein